MKLHIFLTGLGLLFTAVSCSVGNEGLFATVEKEQKIVSVGSINQYSTITQMAELKNSTVDSYIATGGAALFTRPVTAVTWNAIKIGGQYSTASVGVVGTQGNQIAYAVAGNILYTSGDGITWTPSALALQTGDQPFGLIPIRQGDGVSFTELALVAQTYIAGTGSPALYGYGNIYILRADGTLSGRFQLDQPTPSTASTDTVYPANQVWNLVAACTDGTNYYFLNNTNLWATSGSPALGTTVAITSPIPLSLQGSPQIYGGMVYLGQTAGAGQGFYFSTIASGTNTGALYFYPYTGSTPPSGITIDGWIKGSSQSFQGHPGSLGSFLYNSVNNSLWVGTLNGTSNHGGGYAEIINLGNSPQVNYSSTWFQPQTDYNNYNSTYLPVSIVYCLFEDYHGQFFLGTGSEGMWLWNSSNQTWSQQ